MDLVNVKGFLSKDEETMLLSLFIRDDKVLDFSNNDFSVFVINSTKDALPEKYGMSDRDKLMEYLKYASNEKSTKLLIDLFLYYEKHMEYEYNKNYDEDSIWITPSKYNENYEKLFFTCKSIVENLNNEGVNNNEKDLKTYFSSEYMQQQIDLMFSMQETNPTEAIGKSKELIESCCKTILEEMNISSKNDDINQLSKKVMSVLSLLPENVPSSQKGADIIKAILGNLRTIPLKLAELRNLYGSGHGKSDYYIGVEKRHAILAVNCSSTFVKFVWSTYETMKKEKRFPKTVHAQVQIIPNEAGGNTLIIK